MISATDLVRLGLDPKSLKARFDTPTPGEKEKRLIDRWKNRAQQGRDWNLTHYRLYLAIDRAWDSDFYQASHTLISFLKDLVEQKNEQNAVEVCQRWNMTHLLAPDMDAKTGMPTGKMTLHLPTLHEIILSLARNYTMMRVARIVNERTSIPLFKFEPALMMELNKLRTEVLTQRTDQMARDFGYSATLDQAVTYAGMYGHQIQFITEEWYSRADMDGGAPVPGKEGLRYCLPHPSRTYYDLDHPLWTLNTDTGVSYTGYWRVTTYGNIRQNTAWWNRDRVKMSRAIGTREWQLFFQTTGQCRMAHNLPVSVGSPIDRENQIDSQFFSRDQDDQPVWLTEHFERINLKEDLDEKMPDIDVWLRVVLASDDTPLYVTALPGRPGTVWLWEPTDNRAIQPGMMLAVMPFQDHCSNLLSQGILSSKQNLANVTLFDEDVVDPATVRKDIQNPNETLYRKLNFWPFSGRKLSKQQGNLDQVFKSYRFPPQNISDHLTMIGQLLSMLERVLGMSSQEIGSYASHEQSAEEIRTIHTATGQRYEHIAAWIDRAVEAWKSQIYTYLMTYGTFDAYAYVSPQLAKMAVDAGFTVLKSDQGGMLLQAPVGNLRVESFTAQRDGPNRVPWQQLGGQMVNIVTTFMASPIAQAMGAENMISLLNMALEALGLPRDFRLNAGDAGSMPAEDVKAYIQEQLKVLADQTKSYVDGQNAQLVQQLTGGGPPQ